MTVTRAFSAVALAVIAVIFRLGADSGMTQAAESAPRREAAREQLGYDRVGGASYYARHFHGRRTASGAFYDMHALTAAHRTLPIATRVRVTNLENGRSVMVTINDRGPFAGERIIDLSRAGAEALGFVRRGVATVRVTIVEVVPRAGTGAGLQRFDLTP